MKLSFWDILASMVMLAGLAMATIFINIFVNPYTFVNPFPPPTPVASLEVPTLTPSQRSLPNLWTSTPETPGAQLTELAFKSATPSATASVTGTRLVLPTGTPTRTRTKTPTNTPNKSLTSAVIAKTATKTKTSAPSDTTKPTTPGKPTTSSAISDATPTFTWTASTDANGIDYYQIYWNTSASCGGTLYTGSSSNSWTKSALTANDTYYVCARAVDDAGNVSNWSTVSDAWTFSDLTNPTDPGTPTTSSASTDTTPTFTWTASTDGGSGIYGYEVYWGTVNACGTVVTTRTVANYTPSALTTNGNYYICVRARDRVGNLSNFVGPVLFTLNIPLPPSATTSAASSISSSGATLNGTINANNFSTVVTFQYGLTTSYGSTGTAVESPVTGLATTPVTFAASGLIPGSTYYFRVVGVNIYGTTNGARLTFVTSKADQAALTVAVDHSPVVYGTTAILSTTGGSGTGAVTYSVGGSTGCSVSGTTLSVTNASGLCNVVATKAADATYNAISSAPLGVSLSLANQAALTAIVNHSPVVYGTTAVMSSSGGSGTGAVTYSTGGSTGCSVSGTTLSVTDASGTCDVTATKAADSNYNAVSSAALPVSLQKANQATLTVVNPSPVVYGDTPTLSTTGGGGTGAVTYSEGGSAGCSIAGDILSVLDVSETCNVTASKAADTNYNAATSASIAVTLAKATPVITFDPAPTPDYLGGDFTVSASTTNSDDNTLTYSRVSGPCSFESGSTFSSTGAGTCVVQANGAATTNFNATSETQSVTIAKATPVITFDPPPAAIYPGDFTVNATTTNTDSSALTYSRVSGNCLVPVGATFTTTATGTCVVQANGAATANFSAASETQTVTISS